MSAHDATYDESRWPLAIVTSPPEPIDEEQIGLIYQRVQTWLARETDVGIVMDSSHATSFGPGARKQIVFEVARLQPRFNRYVIMGVVTPNAFLRGGVTALHWIIPPKHPWRMIGTRADAVEWVSQKLAERQASALRGAARP